MLYSSCQQKIIEMEGENMEFWYGLGFIVIAALLILLPTKLRKMKKKPDDDLERFFPENESSKEEPLRH